MNDMLRKKLTEQQSTVKRLAKSCLESVEFEARKAYENRDYEAVKKYELYRIGVEDLKTRLLIEIESCK